MNGWLGGYLQLCLPSLLDKSVYRDTYTAVVSRSLLEGIPSRLSISLSFRYLGSSIP